MLGQVGFGERVSLPQPFLLGQVALMEGPEHIHTPRCSGALLKTSPKAWSTTSPCPRHWLAEECGGEREREKLCKKTQCFRLLLLQLLSKADGSLQASRSPCKHSQIHFGLCCVKGLLLQRRAWVGNP